ncbi:helix-turn-helix domain-containing protein [Phenylobacterium montanum]|uniref:Helix-turn-helix domain-containing protein n=1 Tax=Phenylobacterium montanum TaxID=2823693 RepID=A0A975IWR2_9CAUL|nr:helix-turn-helix domain-containing protein [Caulobacter sp. S6]QUD88636.1 helix-turn-helix domain-containing protein [Caulobacter sp. S6]
MAIGRLSGALLSTNASRITHTTTEPVLGSGYLFYLMLRGELEIRSETLSATLTPGDMAFLEPAPSVEFIHGRGGGVTVALFLPAQQLAARACGRPLDLGRSFAGDSGLAACISALVSAATRNHDRLSAEEAGLLQNSLVDAIVHMGQAEESPVGYLLSARQAEALDAIKQAGLRRLDDPDLTPGQVACAAGVPVRTLHRLFQASGGTFRGWLRDRRLERCRIELLNGAPARDTVTTIAFRWGFNDLTSFSRAFRTRYGISPRQMRAGGDCQMGSASLRRGGLPSV